MLVLVYVYIYICIFLRGVEATRSSEFVWGSGCKLMSVAAMSQAARVPRVPPQAAAQQAAAQQAATQQAATQQAATQPAEALTTTRSLEIALMYCSSKRDRTVISKAKIC